MGKTLRKIWSIICTLGAIQSIIQWIGIPKLISGGGTIAVIIWSVFEHRPTIEIVVIAIATFAAILWLCIGLMKLRRRKPISIPQQHNLLEQVLESDKSDLGSRIYVRDYKWEFKGLREPDAFIELIFTLINAAVFAVNVTGVTGRFLIEEHECAQEVEFAGSKRLPHGESQNIRIRQRLTRDMAALIIGRRNLIPTSKMDAAKKGKVNISLKACHLLISSEIEGEASKPNPFSIGGDYEVNIP